MLVRRLVASGLVVIAVSGPAAPAASQNDSTRAVYLSALDAGGAPVTDLAAAELSIKEGDRVQPVVSLSPARALMSIAVLVDDSGPGLDQFRLGLARMMNRLILDAEFSIIGLAGQNQTLLDFTQQSDKLVPAVRGLRARTGQGGQHLIEAVGSALAAEDRREAVRPIVVVVTGQSPDSGNGSVSGVMDRLARTGAIFYVIEVAGPSRGGTSGQSGDIHAFARANDAAETDRARSQLLNDGPPATGGRREQLVDVTGVPSAMGAIAEELAAQYVLEFHSGANPGDPSRISIATTRGSVKIHAPIRASARRIR